MVVDEPSSPSPKEEEEKEARKTWLENPAHVLPAQFSVLKFEYNSRYKPVKKVGTATYAKQIPYFVNPIPVSSLVAMAEERP